MNKNKGFTLIELLVVIAIVGVLSSVVLVSLNTARMKARDTQRLMDMREFQKALAFYYDKYGQYPAADSIPLDDGGDAHNNSNGWDVGSGIDNSRILLREDPKILEFISKTPQDPMQDAGDGYRYSRYGAGANGCNVSRGSYYVIAIPDMEMTSGVSPQSPGWSCSGRNWQTEYEWVSGQFER